MLVGTLGLHPAEDRWLFQLQGWALSQGISSLICDLDPYEPCRVAGIVERLVIDPARWVVETAVADGTGTVVAQWLIRRPTPELVLAAGRAVVLEGVVWIDIDGELVIPEPAFETVPFPEVT